MIRTRTVVILSVLLAATAVGSWSVGFFLHSNQPAGILPEMVLHADSATQDGSFAMAVGPMDNDVEGLCILDFLTGELTVTVLNTRNAKFNAVFKANVIQDLGIDQSKRPKYLMSTGQIQFPRGGNIARPASSVVYVLDTTTGNYAAYGLPWRRELAKSGRSQSGQLALLDSGKARTAAIRE